MTDPEKVALVESMLLLLRREDFDELLDRAAERGAERALSHLGLESTHAARDISELRDLLEAWRDVRRTAWQTTIKVATTGMVVLLWGHSAMAFMEAAIVDRRRSSERVELMMQQALVERRGSGRDGQQDSPQRM